MTDRPERRPSDTPRAEAPRWTPLAGLAGLVVMLLFTAWFIDTEPAPNWPAPVPPGTIFVGLPDAVPGDGGPGDGGPGDGGPVVDAAVDAAGDAGVDADAR